VKIDQENLGIALDIFYQMLATGTIKKSEHPRHFMRYEQESEIREILEFSAERFGLFVCGYKDAIYLSPGINNQVFGLTNSEIKLELGRGFNNPEMYAVFFIMHVIVAEFYRESIYDTHRPNLPKEYLLDTLNRKVQAMAELEDLNKTSEEYEFNFKVVKDLWNSLTKTEFRDDSDEIKQRGVGSKVTLINETVKFMKKQGLVEEHNDAIYLTDRFKAMVAVAYNNHSIQSDITDFIDSL